MNVKITSDSTCDLSPELLRQYDVPITPYQSAAAKGSVQTEQKSHRTTFMNTFMRKANCRRPAQ